MGKVMSNKSKYAEKAQSSITQSVVSGLAPAGKLFTVSPGPNNGRSCGNQLHPS